jgi:stearoyl-CoA desaturase (delta-9 desaturase)
MEKYGHGTPDDWIERKLYTRRSWLGIVLMFIKLRPVRRDRHYRVGRADDVDPVTAAGIINGIGHYWGYRNYDCADAATNIIPAGPADRRRRAAQQPPHFATSAKLSSKWYEFDIGWATSAPGNGGPGQVKKRAPAPKFAKGKLEADFDTLQSVIANRYDVMAKYAKSIKQRLERRAGAPEAQGGTGSALPQIFAQVAAA